MGKTQALMGNHFVPLFDGEKVKKEDMPARVGHPFKRHRAAEKEII